jgi:putative PIN family toxin of toxin-antitoxin system
VKIVLDTSVLISALRSRQGAAAQVVKLILDGELEVLLDYKLICEYRDVALRPRNLEAYGVTESEVRDIIDDLEARAIPVWVAFQHRPLSPDQDDDMVLDVAINGQAEVIATNNRRHFEEAARQFGIRVSSPRELLIELRSRGIRHAGS